MLNARIRFRLAGPSFPPRVCYKIYTQGTVHYICGEQLMGEQSSRDSFRVMGRSQYIRAIVSQEKFPMVQDVGSLMEMNRYLAELDSRAVRLGGRANDWRIIEYNEPFYEFVDLVYKAPEHINRAPRKQKHGSYLKKIKASWYTPSYKVTEKCDVPSAECFNLFEDELQLFEWAKSLNVEQI